MKSFWLIVTTILLSFVESSWAYSPMEGNVSTYVGPFLYKTNFTTSHDVGSAPTQGGLGWIVLGDINDHSSLEIGIFLTNKIYYREQRSSYIAEQTKLTHIAMGYRRWFNETFSGSLTFFSAYSMGEPLVIHNDFTTEPEFKTSAHDTTQYGFDLALQTEIWKNEKFALVIDTRYSRTFTYKSSENGDHYGMLFGVQYQLQEKKPGANFK